MQRWNVCCDGEEAVAFDTKRLLETLSGIVFTEDCFEAEKNRAFIG